MKSRGKLAILGLAGALAALVVASTAFAQAAPNSQAVATYQQYFIERLAAALGTTTDGLNSAMTTARNDTVDQAAADGVLTQQQAEQIKSQPATISFGFGGPDRGNGNGMSPTGGGQTLDVIAQVLGMTTEELANQLQSGKSLAELASGKEQAVKDAIVAAEKTRLDQAVEDGQMTQEQENQILDRIQNSDLNSFGIGGAPGRGGPGGGFGEMSPGKSV